jgi:hypothetical protein
VEKGEKLSQSETLRIETVNGARRRGLQKKKKHTHGALWRGESIAPPSVFRSATWPSIPASHSSKGQWKAATKINRT